MKRQLLIICLLLVAGCYSQQESARTDGSQKNEVQAKRPDYVVLKTPPDQLLDDMASNYSADGEQWKKEWLEGIASSPIDGQRTIELLEIACYADVMCHRIEYPLRVATLEYIGGNLDSPDVRNALQWIRTSYKSGLPLDAPGDRRGNFRGVLVQSMSMRLTEYANDLLQLRYSKKNRNDPYEFFPY